eukprot:scaffold3082_cov119-Isochrysis_galbana.AAC.4
MQRAPLSLCRHAIVAQGGHLTSCLSRHAGKLSDGLTGPSSICAAYEIWEKTANAPDPSRSSSRNSNSILGLGASSGTSANLHLSLECGSALDYSAPACRPLKKL